VLEFGAEFDGHRGQGIMHRQDPPAYAVCGFQTDYLFSSRLQSGSSREACDSGANRRNVTFNSPPHQPTSATVHCDTQNARTPQQFQAHGNYAGGLLKRRVISKVARTCLRYMETSRQENGLSDECMNPYVH
jgi:hypothetical protein